jgi:hypothetical protein
VHIYIDVAIVLFLLQLYFIEVCNLCIFFTGCNLVFISHIVFKLFSMIVYVHIFFSVVILFTMEQERNDGGHQCGQQGEQQAGQNIRSSPRLSEKRKAEELQRLLERRKRLTLPTPPPASTAEDQEDEEEHDEDFSPDDEGSGHDDGAAGGDDAALAAVGDGDKGKFKPQSMCCSPASFIKLLNALPNDLKGQVVVKGFGGLLNFKSNYLKRDVSSWLMRKFNPKTMKLEIGGGKEINVSHHVVWCATLLN